MQKTKIRYLNIRKRNELMVKNRKRRLRSVILFILENETVLYSGNSNIRAIKLFIKLVSSDFFDELYMETVWIKQLRFCRDCRRNQTSILNVEYWREAQISYKGDENSAWVVWPIGRIKIFSSWPGRTTNFKLSNFHIMICLDYNVSKWPFHNERLFSVTIDPLGALFFRKTGRSSKTTPQRMSHSWDDNREKSFNTFSCKPLTNQNSKQTEALEPKTVIFNFPQEPYFQRFLTPIVSMELNQS